MSNTSPFDVTLAPACTPCEKDRTTFCCDGTPCTDQSLPCASCVSYAVRGGGGGGQIPDLHACCGYAGVYGMLQSTDEVDASSWSGTAALVW